MSLRLQTGYVAKLIIARMIQSDGVVLTDK